MVDLGYDLPPNLDKESPYDESESIPQISAFGVNVRGLFEEKDDQAYDSSKGLMSFDKTEGRSSHTISLYDE